MSTEATRGLTCVVPDCTEPEVGLLPAGSRKAFEVRCLLHALEHVTAQMVELSSYQAALYLLGAKESKEGRDA